MKLLSPDAGAAHLLARRGEIMRSVPPRTRSLFKGILARVRAGMSRVFTDTPMKQWLFVVCATDGVLWIDLAYSRCSNLLITHCRTVKKLATLAQVTKVVFRTDNKRLEAVLSRFNATYSEEDKHWSINARDL